MNYLSQLTEDEIRYVCSVIPHEDSIKYFKRYPKDFAKIMPGFRVTGMKSQEQISALLFKCRNQPFISSFIENHINEWIDEIQKFMAKKKNEGNSKESVLLQTLPLCFFIDNINLLFKLIKEEYSVEYVSLLNVAVKIIKEKDNNCEKLEKKIEKKEIEIDKIQKKLEIVQVDLVKTKNNLNKNSTEVRVLKQNNANLEKLKTTIIENQNEIKKLRTIIQEREKSIKKLKSELSENKHNRKKMEIQICPEIYKKQKTKIIKQEVVIKPKCPIDLNDFKDQLGYNFTNIGIPSNSVYFSLLKEHLSKILFQGIPILINRSYGMTLIRCISYTLIGTSKVSTLSFKKDFSIQIIDEFLSTNGRIVCLDNFIGNYNESELIPLFDIHMDKIIFLTVAYDRTINFIPAEFLNYCHYLNLNRIKALLTNKELQEDPKPYIIKEEEISPQKITINDNYSSFLRLREMFGELEICKNLIEQKCTLISNEKDLCRILAFDVLPYCIDVLQIKPYNTSERFIKYAGDVGKCQYKDLFKEWFT